jgi:endonuclease/exonuclease/phosphatase family metal-dependent hydrolase
MRLLPALVVLLLAGAASAGELKIANWNLNWLTERPTGDATLPGNVRSREAEDFARLRQYALALAADVVAFEEVDGPDAAARVFPPDRYVLHLTQDRVVQRVGFAVRRGLAFTANPDLTSLDPNPRARFPLRSGADITLALPGGGRLRLLAVHLKSGCRSDALDRSTRPACATLARQLPPLAGWVAARAADGTAFILLGDFNRWMEDDDAFYATLARAAPLRRATVGLADPCWGGTGAFTDQIIAGGAARVWLEPDTLRVMTYREQGAEWQQRLSDDCPLSVRLAVPD